MSTLALRSAAVSRLSGLPFSEACKIYFLLGLNTRGQWVIRENSGRRAGVFLSRQAALRSRVLRAPMDSSPLSIYPTAWSSTMRLNIYGLFTLGVARPQGGWSRGGRSPISRRATNACRCSTSCPSQ